MNFKPWQSVWNFMTIHRMFELFQSWPKWWTDTNVPGTFCLYSETLNWFNITPTLDDSNPNPMCCQKVDAVTVSKLLHWTMDILYYVSWIMQLQYYAMYNNSGRKHNILCTHIWDDIFPIGSQFAIWAGEQGSSVSEWHQEHVGPQDTQRNLSWKRCKSFSHSFMSQSPHMTTLDAGWTTYFAAVNSAFWGQ